jgi:hypothetical protein
VIEEKYGKMINSKEAVDCFLDVGFIMSRSMNFTSIYLLKASYIYTFETVFRCISKVHLV